MAEYFLQLLWTFGPQTMLSILNHYEQSELAILLNNIDNILSTNALYSGLDITLVNKEKRVTQSLVHYTIGLEKLVTIIGQADGAVIDVIFSTEVFNIIEALQIELRCVCADTNKEKK